MADNSAIEWTEATWNPVVGCSVISPGCTNCYAMKMAARLEAMGQPIYQGLTQPSKAGTVWTGRVELSNWGQVIKPLSWKRPRMIFVNSMSDLFHESLPDKVIDTVFAVMLLVPQHVLQVLTKRADRMRRYMVDLKASGRWILWRDPRDGANIFNPFAVDHDRFDEAFRHIWLGVSAEDQKRADERIPHLLDTPTTVRWVSAEPLLGPIDFSHLNEWVDDFKDCGGHPDPHWPLDSVDATWLDALRGRYVCEARNPQGEHLGFCDAGLKTRFDKGIDWVVVGGESGPGARPMHPDWARSIRDQCAAAGVPFFFKQWGAFAPIHSSLQADFISVAKEMGAGPWHCFEGGPFMQRVNKKAAGRLLDGRTHDGMPERANA